MVAIGPAARIAFKYGPIALEAARRLDKQLRPHVLAYSLASSVDGYVGRWTTDKAAHWIVFPSVDGEPLRSFPPLSVTELALADRELDRTALRHHRDLPEAKVRQTADRVVKAPGQVAGRLLGGRGH